MEQDVWNRVARRELPPGGPAVAPLLPMIQENLGVCRMLLPRARGPRRELLGLLLRREEEILQTVRGLGKLAGEPPASTGAPMARGEERALLRGCYHRCARLQGEFLGRGALPQWGLVFQALADREAEQCLLLARLLG